VGVLLLSALGISAFLFLVLWTIGMVGVSAFYWSRMDTAEERINKVFTAVEIAVSNNLPEAEDIYVDGKEYFAIERLLQLNPDIVGSAIALNPDCDPKKGQLFAPYAYRDSTGIHNKRLDTPDYDYLHKNWYVKPMEEGKGVWSEPYVDIGGSDILMTTYSMPIFNKQGDMCAVQTADLSLNWIAEQTQELDSITNTDYYLGTSGKGSMRSFIITDKGHFIVHPDSTGHPEESLQEFLKRFSGKIDEQVIKEIMSKEADATILHGTEGNGYFFFSLPMERTGWSIVTMVPFRDLFQPVNYVLGTIAIVVLIVMVVVALVCWHTIRRITRPLRQFAASADEIAKGNFDTPLPDITTKDEMLTLHNSFTTMQQSLTQQIEQIKKANEEKGRIEGELGIARDIQMSMLPKQFPAFPERADIDVYALLHPAKEVGGDLYDYLIRDEKLYFCIGDVSGKGIPAAMVMSVTRALFRTASVHDSMPNKIVAGINGQIFDDNESSMFVTFFVGVLDLPTGRLRYCNAGHNAPLLVDDTGVRQLPCDPNLPLGIVADHKFTTQETLLSPMTTLFLYTDGLTEAENGQLELFGDERMVDVAQQAGAQPMQLVGQMESEVADFVGAADQSDDMTMLAVRYTKQQEPDARLSRSITLANDVEQVPQLSAFVEEVCEELGFDMSTTMSINLAIEEAVVNVMDYAYPAGTEGNVEIEAKANSVRLKFIISDWGKPFDPTVQKNADTTLSAEERNIGGLGIYLMRQIMDSINYERTDGKNILTLRKKLPND